MRFFRTRSISQRSGLGKRASIRKLQHACSLGVVFAVLLLLGCSGTSATALPQSVRSDHAVYFVENHGKDDRNIERLIAQTLRSRGLNVESGARGTRPQKIDFLVTYVDRWAWDMRVYMRLIQIDISNPRSGQVVATSRSVQDSLAAMGQRYEDIIARTTNQLLDGAP